MQNYISDELGNFLLTLHSELQYIPIPSDYAGPICGKEIEYIRRGRSKSYTCPNEGQYILVQNIGTRYLAICEVEVFTGE